jgi:polar amino acid transport system substrate-binding protein
MKLRYIQPLLLLLLVSFGYSIAKANERNITIGISTGHPPYYFYHNGQATGVCVDVLHRVAQDLNITISYKNYPWKRLLSSAQQGQVDGIMPLFRTAERESYLHFDGLDIASETNSFFTWKDSEIIYDGSFQSLAPYPLGVVSEYSYGKDFDNSNEFTKVVTQSDQHLIEMFKFKRFSIGVANQGVTKFYAKKEGIAEKIQFLSPVISKEQLYIGFSKIRGHELLAKEFAQSLKKLKETGVYQKILRKYGMNQ